MAGKNQANVSIGAAVMFAVTGIIKITGLMDDVEINHLHETGTDIINTINYLSVLVIMFSTNILHAIGAKYPNSREKIENLPFFEVDFSDVKKKDGVINEKISSND